MELAHNSPLLCSQVRRDIVCEAIYEYLEVAGIFQFVVKYMKNTIRPLWHKIQANKYLKWCINITGAIVIGAIGSGVWEIVLKPILASGQNLVLDMASWGINSYRDDTYAQIAKGFHERNSNYLLQFLLVLLPLVFFRLDRTIFNQKSVLILQDSKSVTIFPRFMEVQYSFLMIIFVIVAIMTFYQTKYINSAITHYQQIFTICRPFLDQQQEEQIASKFAQVRSREDYEAVVNQLKAVGLHNKQTLPEFTPW